MQEGYWGWGVSSALVPKMARKGSYVSMGNSVAAAKEKTNQRPSPICLNMILTTIEQDKQSPDLQD